MYLSYEKSDPSVVFFLLVVKCCFFRLKETEIPNHLFTQPAC